MIELDHDLIGRLERGDCCHENNSDAASHILALGDELESLQAELERSKEAYIRCKEVSALMSEGWRLTQTEADRYRDALQQYADQTVFHPNVARTALKPITEKSDE